MSSTKYHDLKSPLSPRRASDGSVEDLPEGFTAEDWKITEAERTRRRRFRQVWTVARYVISHILVPFLVVMVAFDMSKGYLRKTSDWDVEKTYGTDKRYMSLDHQYDHLWDEDLQVNWGSIKLPKDISDSLGATGIVEYGTIAMFHNLHCLAMVRKTLQEAYYGKRPAFDYTGDKHWPHCLYHMRQGILCHADDTIELPRANNGSLLNVPNISGVTDIRHCRSADKLYKMQDKYVEWADDDGTGDEHHH